MKTTILYQVRKTAKGFLPLSLFALLPLCFSCSKMLETESDLVEFAENHTLNHATDSVYSVMGIINSMQKVADRSVLLGSARGDLMTVTPAASSDLKRLAAFDFATANKYNEVSDYYAVINNCNYFINNVDTAMERRGRNLFKREFAVAKSFRAWTYLQLAINYGEVPFFLEPLMTEKDARDAMNGPRKNISEICDALIADLTPYVDVDLPEYGNVYNVNAQRFFIPMRAILGDLCLWAGHYREAAGWYHDYLTDKRDPIEMSTYRVQWPNSSNFVRPNNYYSPTSTDEVRCFIPMETRVFDGVVSDLPNIYNSTTENKSFYQLTPSSAMYAISKEPIYCIETKINNRADTIYVPRSGFTDDILVGDLRFYANYSISSYGTQDEFSEYNSYTQYFSKFSNSLSRIPLYRTSMLYLRYAEALNRAGLPQSAFAVLKYGMCEDVTKAYVDTLERADAGNLIYFDPDVYKRFDTNGDLLIYGVHALGSGSAHANKYYVLPQPETALGSRQDTIDYQIPLVEDLIIQEMALEGAFEGNRFFDLMRVALRRGDPAYLADPISRRDGEVDEALRAKLMDSSNWYLPLP